MTAHSSAARRLFIDMDNVLVDFPSGIERLTADDRRDYQGRYDEVPGIFALMRPMPGAIEAYHILSRAFDTYILSTAPWRNPSAWIDKLEWVHLHLGAGEETPAYKRLILSHHKHLVQGDFIIDDRTKNGVDRFGGEHIHFGTDEFKTWEAVVEYLLPRA